MCVEGLKMDVGQFGRPPLPLNFGASGAHLTRRLMAALQTDLQTRGQRMSQVTAARHSRCFSRSPEGVLQQMTGKWPTLLPHTHTHVVFISLATSLTSDCQVDLDKRPLSTLI